MWVKNITYNVSFVFPSFNIVITRLDITYPQRHTSLLIDKTIHTKNDQYVRSAKPHKNSKIRDKQLRSAN